MEIKVYPGKVFIRNVKRLAKKYKSIIQDLQILERDLIANPLLGTDLGNGLRKVRMAITAKGRGKSGGARVITHFAIVSVTEGAVTLLTIYDKAEQENITDKELKSLLEEIWSPDIL